MDDAWHARLRESREDLGLTRSGLANLAGVSSDTVRAYEQGRRRPTRQALDSVLAALRMDRLEANQIRHALGFSSDYLRLGRLDPTFMFSLEELPSWMDATPWPQFVADENLQIVVANSAAQRIWRVDLHREFLELHERSLTKFASDPRFANCVLNWEEMIAYGVSIWKGHHLGAESLDAPSAYFDVVLKELASGDPQYVSRFLDVWQRTDGKTPKVRDRYRVVWQTPGFQPMTFMALTSSANEWEGLAFNDWIPVDADSWSTLSAVVDVRGERP